jgi:hypothetical protein
VSVVSVYRSPSVPGGNGPHFGGGARRRADYDPGVSQETDCQQIGKD